ncbi:MAG: hypothetical protein ABEI52_08415 [Halobacteriaceae archaeon]
MLHLFYLTPTACAERARDGVRRVALACLLGVSVSAGTLALLKCVRMLRKTARTPLDSLKDALLALALTRAPSTRREVLNHGVCRYDLRTGTLLPCLSRRCDPGALSLCSFPHHDRETLVRAAAALMDGADTDVDGDVLDDYLRTRFADRASVVEFLGDFLSATPPLQTQTQTVRRAW